MGYKTEIIRWLNDHPTVKAITSGSLESVPIGGSILRNLFDQSTKQEEEKTKMIFEMLKNLENASDKQLETFNFQLYVIQNVLATNSDKLETALEISMRLVELSLDTNARVKELKIDMNELKKNVNILLQKSDQTKDDFWLQFDVVLNALEGLFKGHVKLIDRAIAPILEGREDGLQTTATMFRALVFNDDLPLGYSEAITHLGVWTKMKEFHDEANSARLNAVKQELPIFQYAVFPMMFQSGYLGDYGFGSASKLWSLLSKNSKQAENKEKLQKDIQDNFLLAFQWLAQERSWHESRGRKVVRSPVKEEEYMKLLEISQLDKPEGVVKLVSEWCRGWQYLVKQQLWNDNLQNAITELRYAKYNQKAKEW